MNIKLGLKVWSTNLQLIPVIKKHIEKNSLDYIELFSVPDSYDDTAQKWSEIETQFIIHAAHSMSGLNFAKVEMESRNRQLAEEAFYFADLLKAYNIIFHPGSDGDISETIRQMKPIAGERIVIENKPYTGINNEVCVGSTPAEIKQIMAELNVRFCLDFGHAIASANSHKIDPLVLINDFMGLKPAMFHLTDGDYFSEIDSHDPFGKGSFPLGKLVAFIPLNSMVTDEARRENLNSIDEYLRDRDFINTLFNK